MKRFFLLAACVVWTAGSAMGAEPTTFYSDYGQALKLTRETKDKPLLVVLENQPQKQQVEQVSHKSELSADFGLLNDYTVCRVDVSSEYGQAVAKAFKAEDFPHTVVIDRSVKWQLYNKSGEFSSPEWNSMLVKYSQPEPAAQPVRYYYNYNSSCPNCRR